MTHRCRPESDLPVVLELGADDPLRIECEACPRCASLLRELQAFLRGDDAFDAAESSEADRVLSATISDAFPLVLARSRRRGPVRLRLAAGSAFAAAAALAAFVLLRGPDQPPLDPSGVLRGGPTDRGVAQLSLDTSHPERGIVVLSWGDGGSRGPFRLEVYSSSLDTLLVVEGVSAPTFRIDASTLRSVPADSTLLVRVQSSRGATLLSSSGLHSVGLR